MRQSLFYIHYKKQLIIIVLLILTVLCTSYLSLNIGPYSLSLANHLSDKDWLVLSIRLQRIFAALITGAALGVAGALFQTLLRNPLASPTTLGISQGAAFGASVCIIFLTTSWYLVALSSFFGGMLVILLLWALNRYRHVSPATMILAGVALSSLFLSGTMLSQYFADEVKLSIAVFWSFGDIGRSNFHELFILFAIVAFCLSYFILVHKSFDALSLGDERAANLGINVSKFRFINLTLACLITTLATSFHGVIAFLGLLAPHIARKLIGNQHLFFILVSGLLGALLLLWADILSRIITVAGNVPVGVITSFLGAPLFLYLLLLKSRPHA
jgi:iron complex transport system permease protein